MAISIQTDIEIHNCVILYTRSVSQNIATPSTSLAYAYVFLCSENDQGGTIGIAWVGGTCSSTRYGRSSVNEYLNSDVITGGVSLIEQDWKY